MTFEINPRSRSTIDFSEGTERDRLLICLRNGQIAVFKLNAKGTRLVCDRATTSAELLTAAGQMIQPVFRTPSGLYGSKRPRITDVLQDMEVQLPHQPHIAAGRPLDLAIVVDNQTFRFTPEVVKTFEVYEILAGF